MMARGLVKDLARRIQIEKREGIVLRMSDEQTASEWQMGYKRCAK